MDITFGGRSSRLQQEVEDVRLDAKPGQELTITYPLISFSHEVTGLRQVSAPDPKMKFEWLGNMVVSSDPTATKTPLFLGKPRGLPEHSPECRP
jgi:hypothetical protein